jgi:hypothetical protein
MAKDKVWQDETVQVLKEFYQNRETELQARIAALEEAGRPFAHPDLCKRLPGNGSADDAIIFVRNNAVITLADCRKLAALLGE